MFSTITSGVSGLGSSSGQEHCVVFLGMTLNYSSSQSTQVYEWVQ